MSKIKVLFPFVEAGFGHIMPMRSIVQSFSEKYGDKVEIIASPFFSETGNKHLIRYEKSLVRHVKVYNKVPAIGHIAMYACQFFGSVLSSLGSIRVIGPFAYRAGVDHMREIDPDVVFSTHWATNYYAEHVKEDKPFTVMYCPDAQLNKLFEYNSDLCMISMPYGYEKALRKRKFNIHNLKYVPFFIRNEAFQISRDKAALRRKLGIPENNFTIVLAEGGYGIGKIKKITERLIALHKPLTVIPVCGTNEKLYDYFKTLKPSEEVTFCPYGFTDGILELEAAADIFCGKSGNILAEATFFGNPSIITHFANMIEKNIADHYLNSVGVSIKQFCPKKAVNLIVEFAENPELIEPYRRAAEDYHVNFGSEKAADILWEEIKRRFPDHPELR